MNKEFKINVIVMGIVCGIFTGLGIYLQLPVWIMFAGLTSYYIHEDKTYFRSFNANMAGVAIGFVILLFAQLTPSAIIGGIVTGVLSSFIIYLTKFKITSSSACVFVGGFSTLGFGGQILIAIICFFIGGLVMSYTINTTVDFFMKRT